MATRKARSGLSVGRSSRRFATAVVILIIVTILPDVLRNTVGASADSDVGAAECHQDECILVSESADAAAAVHATAVHAAATSVVHDDVQQRAMPLDLNDDRSMERKVSEPTLNEIRNNSGDRIGIENNEEAESLLLESERDVLSEAESNNPDPTLAVDEISEVFNNDSNPNTASAAVHSIDIATEEAEEQVEIPARLSSEPTTTTTEKGPANIVLEEELHAAAEVVMEAIRARVLPPLTTIPAPLDVNNADDDDQQQQQQLEVDEKENAERDSDRRHPHEHEIGEPDKDNHVEVQEELLDDRTLLDIFGEVAKEYLTQKLIPDTDVECRWDWRSIRCEPSCHCSFQHQSGDYHLGRACRRRTIALAAVCEPSVYIYDQPVPKRIFSLVQQTTGILRAKIQRAVGTVVQNIRRYCAAVQENVCSDWWSRRHQKNPTTGESCWSTTFPVPTANLWEKMICGRMDDVPMCDGDDDDDDSGQRPAFSRKRRIVAAKLDRPKKGRFADLYELEF